MIPLSLLLTKIKAYGRALLLALLALAILAVGTWILVLTHQRNVARQDAAKLQTTVNGYVAAAKSLQAKLDAAAQALTQEDAENQKLLADLQHSVPKDPAQATAWAIAASQKISQEAKR
jgi:hypothetical protein